MIGPINRLPLALLGLLDFQNLGKYPNELEESIRATIDIKDILAFGSAEIVAPAAFAPSAAGTLSVATVPDGETWYLLQAAASCVTGAAEAIDFQWSYAMTIGGNPMNFGIGPIISSHPAGAAAVAVPMGYLPAPVWIPPRGQIRLCVTRIVTAASISVQTALMFLRVPI